MAVVENKKKSEKKRLHWESNPRSPLFYSVTRWFLSGFLSLKFNFQSTYALKIVPCLISMKFPTFFLSIETNCREIRWEKHKIFAFWICHIRGKIRSVHNMAPFLVCVNDHQFIARLLHMWLHTRREKQTIFPLPILFLETSYRHFSDFAHIWPLFRNRPPTMSTKVGRICQMTCVWWDGCRCRFTHRDSDAKKIKI